MTARNGLSEIHTLQPLGIPAGVDARIWRQSLEARLNDLLDRAMSIITALDTMEVDPDLESSDDDEHSLGWPDRGPGSYGVQCDDREADDCDDEDSHDAEPDCCDGETVTWPENLKSQAELVHP